MKIGCLANLLCLAPGVLGEGCGGSGPASFHGIRDVERCLDKWVVENEPEETVWLQSFRWDWFEFSGHHWLSWSHLTLWQPTSLISSEVLWVYITSHLAILWTLCWVITDTTIWDSPRPPCNALQEPQRLLYSSSSLFLRVWRAGKLYSLHPPLCLHTLCKPLFLTCLDISAFLHTLRALSLSQPVSHPSGLTFPFAISLLVSMWQIIQFSAFRLCFMLVREWSPE